MSTDKLTSSLPLFDLDDPMLVDTIIKVYTRYWDNIYRDERPSLSIAEQKAARAKHLHPYTRVWRATKNTGLVGYFTGPRESLAYERAVAESEFLPSYYSSLGYATRPGKFFRKLMPGLSDIEVADLATLWTASVDKDKELHFSLTPEVAKIYHGDNYSTRYGSSTLQSSCMRHFEYNHVIKSFYENGFGLRALCMLDGSEKVVARAIVWDSLETMGTDDLPFPEAPVYFIDRVYYSSEVILKRFLNEAPAFLLATLLEDEEIPSSDVNILRRADQNYNTVRFVDAFASGLDPSIRNVTLSIDIPRALEDTRNAPFLDTMAGWNMAENKLYSSNSLTFHSLVHLQQTDGMWPQRGNYSDYYGEIISDDEAVYVNDDWYYNDDVVYDDDGEPMLAREACWSRIEDAYLSLDTAVSLCGTEDWVSDSNPGLVEIDGDYYHPDSNNWSEVIETVSGEFVTSDSSFVVELTDGDSAGYYEMTENIEVFVDLLGKVHYYLPEEKEDALAKIHEGIEERMAIADRALALDFTPVDPCLCSTEDLISGPDKN